MTDEQFDKSRMLYGETNMFSYDGKVRYSEVDSNKNLTVTAAVNYLQDTCVLHSESVGAGVDYVNESGRVWMLGAWRIEFLEDIQFDDLIRVSTWPYGFKSFFGYRNLTISKNDKICVRADSTWMLYSVKQGRLVKVSEEDVKFYPCEDELDMEKCKRKLTTEAPFIEKKEFVIPNTYIDTNGHVNNGKYVQMAADAINLNEKVTVLEVEYRMAAKESDKVICYIYCNEEEKFVEMKNENGDVFAQVKFTLK